MAGIPDQEKLAIVTHFLLSSPPGEIKEVLADVKVILDNPAILTDGVLKGVFRKYNTTNLEVFEGPDGKPFVVSEFGELDAKHYLTGAAEVVAVDHVAHTASAAGPDAPKYTPGPLEPYRAALYAALKEYTDAHFQDNVGACAVFETADGLVAVLSGTKVNLRNYWSGKWRSEWHVDPSAKKASGKINIHIHYFEDGNVQMEQHKEVDPTPVAGGDEKAFAEAVVKSVIAKAESGVEQTLEELYMSMSEEAFKDMRRILPVTKTKLDWTGAQAKLAAGVGKSKGQ